MKSLQVTTPSKNCIYKCPFCIAKTHEHNNNFSNLYEENIDLWMKKYIDVLINFSDLKTIVITGTNEPMQDLECVERILSLTRFFRKDVAVELQTRQYYPFSVYQKLDVVSYSISQFSYLAKIKPNGKTNRYVILLTDEFENQSLEDIINQLPSLVTQLTFKKLHKSRDSKNEIDQWIINHSMSEERINQLEKEVSQYKGNLSIRFDENCMEAVNRYMIFREDGNLYNDWDEKAKVKSL